MCSYDRLTRGGIGCAGIRPALPAACLAAAAPSLRASLDFLPTRNRPGQRACA